MGFLILTFRVTQLARAIFTLWGRKGLESNLQVRGNVHLVLLNKSRDQDYFSLLTTANKDKRFLRNKRYRITRSVSPSDVLPHYFFCHLTDHLDLNSKPIIVTYGYKFFWASVQWAENCRLLMQVRVHFIVYVSDQATNLQLCVFFLTHKYSHAWDTRAKLNPCQQVLSSWKKKAIHC